MELKRPQLPDQALTWAALWRAIRADCKIAGLEPADALYHWQTELSIPAVDELRRATPPADFRAFLERQCEAEPRR